jgi:hypothetical protein
MCETPLTLKLIPGSFEIHMSLDNRHTETSIQRFVVQEIARRFLDDGLVAVFTLRSLSKPAVNAFFDKLVSAYNS